MGRGAAEPIGSQQSTGVAIMFQERAYTSLGEKIVTVIGYLVFGALLAVLMVGYQITL